MESHGNQRCAAFRAAMDVLGKPWNGLILSALEGGPQRFTALADQIPPIGDRMLSCRLKELEASGLVVRAVEPGPPVRVSYELTATGRGFAEVKRAVEGWGAQLLDVREGAAGDCAGACPTAGAELPDDEVCEG